MASTSNPEANEIRRRGRQRLIGAVVLVALLVVFVPMLLDSEPRPKPPTPDYSIPSKDSAPALPAPAPAPKADGVTPAQAGAPSRTSPPDAKLATPVPPPAKVAAVEAAKAGPAKAEPKTDAKATPAPPKLEGFAVQVGAFRDEAKLTQARQKLSTAGVVHYTERLDSPAGPLTRLRAGPFATRDQAEGALAALKRASLDGKVVALP